MRSSLRAVKLLTPPAPPHDFLQRLPLRKRHSLDLVQRLGIQVNHETLLPHALRPLAVRDPGARRATCEFRSASNTQRI